MSESSPPLAGPDLTQGIASSALADGAMLLGHARGEPVLLARRGDEVFAIGAVCSHYSGPLNEGLLAGDTVRCPWHHACFSLRTGQPVRPPALNPVACWVVERRGDTLLVTSKRPVARAPTVGADIGTIAIIGAGAAGEVAAETLRREGYHGAITLIGAEPDGPVDRPNLSKDYLAGNAPEAWIPLRDADFYLTQEIELITGAAVAAIPRGEQRLVLADGRKVEWDRLLLATGAEPIRLTIPGADRIHYLRSLADSRALIAAAAGARRAVVVGASFIGLEVAASLRARGLEVHVVAPETRPLERVMGPEVGDFIRTVHEEHGVVFHLGTRPQAVAPESVALENGETLPADLVIAGVGVRPRTGLAEEAGLAVDRGVVVDQFLETSRPGVFAAGDLARWPDPRTGERIRVEHWVVAERMGQAAARNMLARRERFDAVPFFWSQHYDVTIAYVGHAAAWDAVEVRGTLAGRDATVVYRKGGKALAVATVFRDGVSLAAEAAMERGDAAGLERVLGPEG
jgi:NADPH-dependent 2,4-dienoyl-CoA reductase/sulfur reductase-like enzyme/nitrite reductase/ring-hydroxylating ferredoxin subunit